MMVVPLLSLLLLVALLLLLLLLVLDRLGEVGSGLLFVLQRINLSHLVSDLELLLEHLVLLLDLG